MMTSRQHTPADSGFVQLHRPDAAAVRTEILAGLSQAQAVASPKHFYDTLGSRLFEAICELPEYYLTRTESAIFDAHLGDIVRSIGPGATLIDLGAGNCMKAARLLPLLQPRQYVPVDISVDFLQSAVTRLRQRFPAVAMTGVGLDFTQGLPLPPQVSQERRLFFYPGSSIGNFTTAEAARLLCHVRAACAHGEVVDGGLLIGVDLLKDAATLEAAYDDALGLTAAFNLNLLRHFNQLIGSDFRVQDWRHRACFNAAEGRVEMHLEARHSVTVNWSGGARRFVAGERIHTENSYKYAPAAFLRLLESCGFELLASWTDPAQQFMLCHARAA